MTIGLNEIVANIFNGSKCQQDADSRIGDFVEACAKHGVVAVPGKAVYDEKDGVTIYDWSFDFKSATSSIVGYRDSIVPLNSIVPTKVSQ